MAQVSRLALLEDSVKELKDRLEAIEDTAILGTFALHIETFAPEPYEVKRPIPVSLQCRTDGYLASFVEANVNSSGDTQQEALANVKELILDVFDSLTALPPSKLGPGPARQLAVLREFVNAAQDHEGAREQAREEAEGGGGHKTYCP
jgi:predicted RNase H-like HicB family nuclease